MTREEISNRSKQLSLENKHLVIEHPTGTGKGKNVAECIKASKSIQKWLICVPEISQIQNYKNDLLKFGNEDLLKSKIHDIICYASLKNYENTKYNLHFNECHRLSDFRFEIAKTIKFDQIISDSATISDEIKTKLWEICPYIIDSIGLDEAIKWNILPQPIIYYINCELDDKKKNLEFKVTKTKEFKGLSEKEYYNKLSESIKYYQNEYKNTPSKFYLKNKMLSLSMERKRFMAKVKTEKGKQLIFKLNKENKRFICFCGTIAQAKELGGKQAISSKDTKNVNAQIIKEFNSLKSNSLFSCGMAIEGMNFFAIDSGIIIQLDREERLPRQKLGRILRSSNPELYILVLKNTQDEKYFNEFLLNSNIDKEYIKEYKL